MQLTYHAMVKLRLAYKTAIIRRDLNKEKQQRWWAFDESEFNLIPRLSFVENEDKGLKCGKILFYVSHNIHTLFCCLYSGYTLSRLTFSGFPRRRKKMQFDNISANCSKNLVKNFRNNLAMLFFDYWRRRTEYCYLSICIKTLSSPL